MSADNIQSFVREMLFLINPNNSYMNGNNSF